MNAAPTAPIADWIAIGSASAVPPLGSRRVVTPAGAVAIFRTADDSYFAISDNCPHRGGPLSEGIVHGSAVTCPLHNWVIDLSTGKALGADEGCVRTYPLKVEAGTLYLAASVLGTLTA